ncbi:MAG: TonB-dependent receptor [Steroidobacteraceae bacterium]
MAADVRIKSRTRDYTVSALSPQSGRVARIACASLSLTAGVLLLAPAARSTEDGDTELVIEQIVVTGSHIPRAALNGPAPVIVFDAAELDASGINTLADFARFLPQNSETMSEAAANSGSTRGTAQFNLRGAGLDATLTLLNGRRIAPYGSGLFGTDFFVDLGAIPAHAIERIEVLKDGASAIYGSEAVAGVVNVILKEAIEGVHVDASYLSAAEGDGEERNFALSGGSSHERSQVSFVLNYLERDAIYSRGRDWSSELDFSGRGGPNQRSPYSSPPTVFLHRSLRWAWDPECPERDSLANRDVLEPGLVELCRFNTAQFTTQNSPAERLSIFATGRHRVIDSLEFFAEVMFAANDNAAVLAPTPVELEVKMDHPDNPFGEDLLALYRAIDTGNRRLRNEGATHRWVAGAAGDVGSWEWESALTGSRSRVKDVSYDAVLFTPLQEAVLGIGGPTGDRYYNPFGANPRNDPALIATFVVDETWSRSTTAEESFDLLVRRDVASLPGGPAAAAIGVQWRRQSLHEELDAVQASGDLAGIGLPVTPLDADRDIRSAFVELALPLHDRVEGQLAVRWDNYSDFGSTINPKLALGWRPTDQVLLRATWGTSFRPPAFRELFDPVTAYLVPVFRDPWRCDATNDPMDCFGNLVPLTSGGNEALDPEKGVSVLFGLVWQSTRVPGLTLGVDLWRIEYSGRIARVSDNFDHLFEQLPPNANPFVLRAPPSAEEVALGIPGRVTGLVETFINADRLDTQGIDIDLEWERAGTRFGDFATRLTWAYLDRYELGLDFAGVQQIDDLAGRYGFFGPLPRHRGNLSMGWNRAAQSVTAQLHYAGRYESATSLWQNGVDTGQPFEVVAWWSLDLQYNYRIERLNGATLRFGCRNCTDNPPPDYNDTITGENIHDGRGALLYVRWTQSI